MRIQTANSVNHDSKLSKQIDDIDSHSQSIEQETKFIEPEVIDMDNEFESTVSDIEGEMSENEMIQYDSWTSFSDSDSCKTTLKSSPKNFTPPEMLGFGANRNVNLFKTQFDKQ